MSISVFLAGCSVNSTENQNPGPEPLAGHALEHHTTDIPPDPGPVPSTVTETAWTWEGTPGTTIQAIHPTPSGALIELNNGLIGMDTTTGETTWSYLLPDSTDLEEDETDLALTPDGTIAAFSPGQTTVLLDTATGQEHQRIDHQTEGSDDLFTPTRLGLPHTTGNLTSTSDHDLHLTLTPWEHQDQDQDTGWETTLPGCDDGNNAIIEQGLLTDETAVIVHTCPTQDPALTGIDLQTGEQTWHLQQGDDYQPDENVYPIPLSPRKTDFFVSDDLLVLENISLQRGTVVIDTTTGDLITDDLPSTADDSLLRVFPNGYLNVVSNSSEHNKVRYELRDFDGSVRDTISTDENVARGSNHSFVLLEESLVKLRLTGEEKEQEIVVLEWGNDNDHRIPLNIELNTEDILNSDRLNREVGPMTFREVPGAVLLREFPRNDHTPRLTALR
ncbi:hypothetical protein [Nocardiopsis xinjiangensis]|uniref:hypothetical protein n=1 Tax=Nocardiopsis xinjiangensis TaxID=124285 RepID=UPI001268ABF2|nr:hypothetical protein [Nocardiopsis xinjiangensis]